MPCVLIQLEDIDTGDAPATADLPPVDDEELGEDEQIFADEDRAVEVVHERAKPRVSAAAAKKRKRTIREQVASRRVKKQPTEEKFESWDDI